MNKENAIEVRNMTKYFKVEYDKANTLKSKLIFWKKGKKEVHTVLDDVSLNIKKGETVALIGTNGSGKSTLLKLMTKIIYPNGGTIETNGKLTSLLELGAGFHPDFTGRENIYFNASIFGLTKEDIENRIDEIIEFSELEEFIDNPIRTYSSGMYMRLAFSVAINVDAEILLIDEILAVGDQHFQEKCFAKLKELRDSGKTIVIVTHALDVVKEMCHRAVWIYKGKLKMDGEPAFVINQYLEQVALDHRTEKQKRVAAGTHHSKGIVFIDNPQDCTFVDREEKEIECKGWQISDSDHAQLRITFDGKEVDNVMRYRRRDVYDVFFEQYGGFLDEKTIGWKFTLSLEGLELGKHKLRVECLEDEKVLVSKESEITLV